MKPSIWARIESGFTTGPQSTSSGFGGGMSHFGGGMGHFGGLGGQGLADRVPGLHLGGAEVPVDGRQG